TMADINIPANDAPAEQAPAIAPPTRTDDQILPSSKWVPIGKSNCILDVQKFQRNPIFLIAVKLLDMTGQDICALDSLRKNLANASRGNKKTTHLLIQNVRVTKLIIHHLKTKHTIHLRIGAKKSPKATKVTKPKADKATKPVGDKAPMLTSTQPPKPKLAPTQPSKALPEKKRKLVKETPNEPSPRKRSKGGLVGKIRKPRSPVKLVDEPSAEDVPVEEPAYNEEEANLQQVLELSLTEKSKTNSGTSSSSDPFIFQRRTSILTKASRHVESPSLDAQLALTDSEMEYDNAASNIDTGDQDEGQAGPNPGVQDEGQVGSNPGDAVESQPQSSHVVHAGPNLKHMDLEATDA
nr:hypothetical protein [Tanacetum cinerariifolium]